MKHAEYLRRNQETAKAYGAHANATTALNRVKAMKRPPKWLVEYLDGIVSRTACLGAELAQWRDLAPDAPSYAWTETKPI
jgi:hypothetical protein